MQLYITLYYWYTRDVTTDFTTPNDVKKLVLFIEINPW